MVTAAQKVSQVPPMIDKTIPIYRKLLKTGRTHYMAVSKLIPDEWEIVEVSILNDKGDIVTLQVRKVAPR